MRKILRILPLLLLPLLASATHEVSGYISAKCVGGYTYVVTIVDYANGTPDNVGCGEPADRDTLRINYGDGTSEVLLRSNGYPPNPDGYPGGQTVCMCRKVCLYTGTHTFPGPGSYHMWMNDQNRMAGICNMIGSVNTSFYLFTTLTIPRAPTDSITTPVITNIPVCQDACCNQCYYFNLGAYSRQGDSLSYSLGNCLCMDPTSGNVIPCPGYQIPPGAFINPVTGTLAWCTPPCTSCNIYNFSIRIIDYKRIYELGRLEVVAVDTMDVELEINIVSKCTTVPPQVVGPDKICVEAGTTVNLKYTGTDPDGETLAASGLPFSESPPATFNVIGGSGPTPTGNFQWQTNCSDIQKLPYQVLVTGTDVVSLESAYASTLIYVMPPAPKNLTAVIAGNCVVLTWDKSPCSNASGYSIYSHVGCKNLSHDSCSPGVSDTTGYTLAGTTSNVNDTTFTDCSVVPGLYYSFVVVANYPEPDNSVSFPSNDTCILIRRDAPILTNVSVNTTSNSAGRMYVRWTKPLVNGLGFDTIAHPGPYIYELQRATGMKSTTFSTIYTVNSPFFASHVDTSYMDNPLNTQNNSYNYQLKFFNTDTTPTHLLGTSPPASSIYLSLHPGDNFMQLSWASVVPWTDSIFMIYRKEPWMPAFTYIATVPGTINNYIDTLLDNDTTFCYYVKSVSYYADPSVLHPLYDSSEVMCSAPKDTIPPCPPQVSLTAQCSTFSDSLVWNNPDHFCKNTHDVEYYTIYYTPTVGGDPELIKTIYNLNDTVYVHDSLSSVAGCYAVTATDSAGNQSAINMVCVDNCPQYQLPNVFTPNGDGFNDFFTPILPYRYIKSIDINIYNRWGQIMFHTINPNINWNGNDQNSGKPCPDGVYYYICTVNEIRVTGIQQITLKGFVQLLRKN